MKVGTDVVEIGSGEYEYIAGAGGVIEVHDRKTGVLVAIQRGLQEFEKNPGMYVRAHTPDGRIVYLERGLELGEFPTVYREYDRVMCDLICQKIVEGKAVSKICEEPGMPPYAVISRWRREHEEFNLAYERARRDRAEVFFDLALDRASEILDKDDAQVAKVQIEAYKWAAEKSDPDRMRGKEAAVGGSTVIVIETGIRRVGDAGYSELRLVGNSGDAGN
jgi:hypothetical protein